MIFYKQNFLKSELNKLEKDGLLNAEQKERIFAHYQISPTQTKANSPLLVVLAAILFSLSLITLVGYNWEQIPAFIRTTLLLSTLLCTQIALYLCKDKSRIWSEFVGILSNFVLLANVALLSQIYHLGDDTASAFLGVAFVSLLVAFALKSGFVFWQAYIFAIIAFCINADDEIFTHSFAIFVLCGFILQAQNGSKALAFVNFFALLAYLYFAPWFFDAFYAPFFRLFPHLAFPLSLLFLAFNAQSYKPYALFTCTLTLIILLNPYASPDFIVPTLIGMNFSFIEILVMLAFLVPALLNLAFKRYFLGILGVLLWLEIYGFLNFAPYRLLGYGYESTLYHIFAQIFYSFLTLIFGVYLIKEKRVVLGILTLCALVVVRYIHLLGDYIGASIIFAIFGCILLIIARKKQKGVQNEA